MFDICNCYVPVTFDDKREGKTRSLSPCHERYRKQKYI